MPKGKTACRGRNFPIGELDKIVIEAIAEKIVAADRLPVLLKGLTKRLMDKRASNLDREKGINREIRSIEEGIKRLYDAVATGLVRDEDIFRQDLAARQNHRDEVLRLKGHLNRQREIPETLFSKENIARLGDAISKRLHDPNSKSRSAYVRLLVDEVDVNGGVKSVQRAA